MKESFVGSSEADGAADETKGEDEDETSFSRAATVRGDERETKDDEVGCPELDEETSVWITS